MSLINLPTAFCCGQRQVQGGVELTGYESSIEPAFEKYRKIIPEQKSGE